MASTDTRSGFRLPWSSDRSNDEAAAEAASEAEPVTEAEPATPESAEPAWPGSDFNAALGLTRTEQRPLEATTPTAEVEEPSPMLDMDTPAAPAKAAPKKSTRIMADLSAAIRATADAAQAQTLDQVRAESAQVVESIRSSSSDGVATLKQQSEDDIAAIREWSKAEIARIKDETDAKITARKSTLEDELAGHAAAVERRVEEVHAEVVRFEAAMAEYRERLEREDDPAQLATMAEELPESPSFAAWADLGTLDIAQAAATDTTTDEPEAVAEAVAETPEAGADTLEGTAGTPEAEATAATAESTEAVAPVDDWYAPAEEATEPEAEAETQDAGWGDSAWGDSPELQPADGAATTGDDAGDVPRWAAGETPEGFPTGEGEEAGDPVDRGAIMAALEAAAEAVVAAEAAAESAETAEAAADVAETAAELLGGRLADEMEYDPEASAAMAARVDAGGYETETFSERLASLTGHVDGEAGDEPRTTQVVVSGLVSVASIASFKRHLGRLPGVQAVAVASGPEGEFVFNVTHRADLSFRDVIPTMPGFAARVTGQSDGTVNVAARDPEAEA
ncbi:MAG TPA: hypothetical protein VFL03_01165 [Candidatus Limnocylindrales bacterium]|nr:hypothetical protein [Candidatus Limnocylindrales bacterium]